MLDRICAELSLGSLTAPPIRLTGGYTHRMFRLQTDEGVYAVKLLNPEIMQRPDVMENYRRAEAFEALLDARGLPVLPALSIGGRKMQQVGDQYLYVCEYYDGHALKDAEITPAHCRKIGAALAKIHGICLRRLQPAGADSAPVRGNLWAELAQQMLSSSNTRTEGELLLSAAPMLTRVTAAMEEAVRRLPPEEALCHNDMDAKNVLWQGEDFRIIDLECLGYANPAQELLDLAISWAGCPAEEARFKAFVRGYMEAGGTLEADAALVYDSRRNYLDWLEYNARRTLASDPEERRIGREQVVETIEKIARDQRERKKILSWMEEIQHG